MTKRKVLIVVHQLNLGGVQKALISALDVIDYSKNDVTLYVRKDRTDLISLVNKNVSKIIINKDKTKYYRKPYAVWLQLKLKFAEVFKNNSEDIKNKLNDYIVSEQFKFEKENYFADDSEYDVAVSYIQSHTAKFLAENIKAKRKIMFYHGSKDEFHEINQTVMKEYEKIYCVSKGALKAISQIYPDFSHKMDYLENYVDAENVREKAEEFTPDYPDDKLILCSCGRITSVKGYDLAVNAAEILRDKGLDFKWYFVGDGAERSNIDKLIADKNLGDYITITGLKDNPYPYIKNCDIYVQPSYEEAHPLSIIEAQILCKPLVTTATVGGKSIIVEGLNGLISDIDSESLADKLLQLTNDKFLQTQIKQELDNKDYAEEYQIFCQKWETLLEEK